MIVTVQQVQTGVINFIEHEIAQKAIGIKKFGIYFILPQINNKVPMLVNKYREVELAKDFFDENGNIKLDEAYATAKTAIAKSGQVEFFGIIFNETDVDKLYSYIKNTTQGGSYAS